MIGESFFIKFIKSRQNSINQIVKYKSNNRYDIEDQLNNEIIEVNRQISQNSKALIEAQIVKFRSSFSKSNNFIEKIGKNVYKQKIEDSINWHQEQLKELYSKRKKLQINLEKIKGIYWLNQIKRFIKIILIGFLVLLSLFVFLSGFMIMIYLLPLFALIFLCYLLATKR
tara:strand:- start:612 stop:1121 length:510 start_codon:yes stop_codon:yes gene_type:complete